MSEEQIKELLREIQNEQHPVEDEETLRGYIKEAQFDINESSGEEIDYSKDLKARKLLKNFVLYDRFKRLAEFKQLYVGDYVNLQAKYYKPTDIQWRKV